MRIARIMSGGQTGVDRAALDAAIARRLAYGGWCPNGGWAEDLPDPPGLLSLYPELRETPERSPGQRTDWNVRDSGATLIVAFAGYAAMSAGTSLTLDLAERYGRPVRVVDPSAAHAVDDVLRWLNDVPRPTVLNVAGPRESEQPGLYSASFSLLGTVFSRLR